MITPPSFPSVIPCLCPWMLPSRIVTFSRAGDQKIPLESFVPSFPCRRMTLKAQLRQSIPKDVIQSFIKAYEQPSLFRKLICKADLTTCDHYVY